MVSALCQGLPLHELFHEVSSDPSNSGFGVTFEVLETRVPNDKPIS